MNAPDTDAAGVLSTATLFHKRRMRVRLVGLKLLDDREKDNVFDFSEAGDPPAEITVEEEVRYDPYVKDKLGKSVLVHEAKIEHRSAAPLWQQAEGPFKAVDVQVFEAPVFDEMQAIDAKTAAMPVAVALPVSAPSISAMRSWNMSTVGFENRE